MDKLQMAQDYIIAEVRRVGICSIDEDKIMDAWKVVDAMQAEADKRKPGGLPEALKEELREVDWSQAPKEYPTTGWYIFKGVAHWISDEIPCGPAPSFGFTGTHIVERPQ